MCFRRAAGNKPTSTIGSTIAVLGSRTPLSVDTRARTGRRPLGDPKWLRCRLVAAMNPWACANRKPSSLAPAPAKFASVRRPRRMPDGDRAGSRLVGESGCWSWGETGSFFDYGFGFLEGLKEGGMARPERRYGPAGGLTLGGIIVIVGIILIFVWSFWIGLIIALVGLVFFGGFARGRWY